jgi:hypothetical protein
MISSGATAAFATDDDFADGEPSGSISGFLAFAGGVVECALFSFALEFTAPLAASSLSWVATVVSVGGAGFFVFVCAAAGETGTETSDAATIHASQQNTSRTPMREGLSCLDWMFRGETVG